MPKVSATESPTGIEVRKIVPVLHPNLRMKPFDVGGNSEKFIVDIDGKNQFEVSKLVYNILGLVDGKRGPEEIAESLRLTTGREFSAGAVKQIVNEYFIPNGFVIDRYTDLRERKEQTFLHLKLSMISQESLRPLTDVLRIMFAKPVFVITAIVSVLVPLYTFWILGSGIAAVGRVRGVELLAVYGIVLLTAFFHELGHSSACAHFAAKHGDIGIALYLFFPVLYADVSDVWNLDRRQRVIVDAAGIYFQMLCVPVLCLIYFLSANTIVLCAIYATYLTIVTALNPFLRFDGYWLVSDFFGVANLRKKSLESVKSFLKTSFGRTVPDGQKGAGLDKKVRIAVVAYGSLSVFFFLVFLLQVGFFLESSIQKSGSVIIELLGEGSAIGQPIKLSDIINAIDALIPSLLILVPFTIWLLSAIRHAGRELVIYYRRAKSSRKIP